MTVYWVDDCEPLPKCLSRTQRYCALQSGEGRYGSGASRGVEADTVCRKAIRSGTSRVRLARTRHVARLRWQRQQARFVNILRRVDEALCVRWTGLDRGLNPLHVFHGTGNKAAPMLS